ncbi:MAG: DMT family transporter [Rhodocyclaceae bacterium]|nr:DMT family transporter [Rhodocyclaceae bacterium]MBX3669076.1 DMT family transporter [Rhodocyclaceae bacterium]
MRLGVLFATFAAIGFSCKAILIKLAYPYGIDALSLLVLRLGFSAPVFAVIAYTERRGRPPLVRRDAIGVAALGLIGFYLSALFDFAGLQYISAGLERVILFSYPTFVVLLSAVVLGKRPGRRELGAMALTYAGIAVSFGHDLGGTASGSSTWLGALFVLGSAISYSIYLVAGGQLIVRIGAARLMASSMLWSALAVGVHFAAARPLAALVQPWQVYALAAAMAVFATILPSLMVGAAIARIGSARFGLIGCIGPVATIFMAWLFLDEAVGVSQLAGAALVVGGVVVVSRK